MKVLIIQQKMIGDVLTSSILFEIIKKKYPDWELHYLINTHTYPVVENNPFIDKFVFFTSDIEKSKLKLFSFLQEIRWSHYDIVIDAYSKLSSNLITAFSKAKTKISKHKSYTAFLYDVTVKYEEEPRTNAGLAIENRLQLLSPLGIDVKKPTKPNIYLNPEEKKSAEKLLISNGINLNNPIFMISVLGSSVLKTYPSHYMTTILDEVVAVNNQAQILFNYLPHQSEGAKSIFRQCDPEIQSRIFFEVFGKSLRQFLAITSYCDALIGNEGGAVNMAKGLNIPTFTIFSPWINKKDWSVFEDVETSVSVHLKDFKPNLYTQPEKFYKKDAARMYEHFEPELFIEKFRKFLSQFDTKS